MPKSLKSDFNKEIAPTPNILCKLNIILINAYLNLFVFRLLNIHFKNAPYVFVKS